MYECETCSRTFASERACEQHMDALDHWAPTFECDTCTKTFWSQQACDQHMDALDHHVFECESCTRTFSSQHAADQHMNALGHWRNYCADCKRAFDNENNLRMHLNSRIHRGTVVACPFCKRGFVTASGVSHHLETGSCTNNPGIDRSTIYHAIRQRDPHGIITCKQLEWHGETHTRLWAPERAWNGQNYECYLCHRQFSALQGLKQHLNSPAHQQKIYHCPSRKCARPFVSLAAMFNHLESESCGFIRFEKVQQNVNGILTGRQRLIGFV